MKNVYILFFILIFKTSFSQPPITFSLNLTPPTCSTCCDGSACVTFTTITGGCNGPYSYYWNSSVGVSCQGSFCYNTTNSITVSDICSSLTQTFNFSTATKINEFQNLNYFKIYPNPVKDKLQIEFTNFETQNIKINIINTFGQKLLTYEISPNNNQINLTELNNGIYFLQIQNQQKTIKLIKN